MKEHDFLLELQKRAKEQEKIIKDMPMPKVFSAASLWLGVHPWRFIIPMSFLISILLRAVLGESYTNFVLSIFKIPLLRMFI